MDFGTENPRRVRWQAVGAWLLANGAAAAVLATGCAAPRLAARATRYEVDVRLDPPTHALEGRATLEVERTDPAEPHGRSTLELRLHPELVLRGFEAEGVTVRKHRRRRGPRTDESEVTPDRLVWVLEEPADRFRLTLDYGGALFQDVAAGEKEGEVHNFAMAAHVGEDGIYLDRDGFWYPVFEAPTDQDPKPPETADFDLTASPVEGFELVAGLERSPDTGDGRLRWSSPFPLEGLVLLGGPLERHSRPHGQVELHAVLAPGKAEIAADILDAAAEYLDRYQPLIGPYPFAEFTVLEAFFSSGFAFPTCTQIVGSQLSARQQYRRHGYLDHELLHNWWGNGLFVDTRDGNWCEGLASYAANYYGFVLDADEEGARKQRRNQSNFLSNVEPDDDKPLGTFGLDEGAGRNIGYSKGAAVFHMLERKIGADALFAGLRRLTAERLGRPTDWNDLQQAFEVESGSDLGPFFDQWVRASGAPELDLVDAAWEPSEGQVEVTVEQGEPAFRVDLPLRLFYGERSVDVVVPVERSVERLTIPCEPRGLTAIELDPDYHVFRRLRPTEIMPTSGLTKRAERLLIVVPPGELVPSYQLVVDSFTRAVRGEPDAPVEGHDVTVVADSEVTPRQLESASVLVIGDAARRPVVREFLARTGGPVAWSEGGFAVDGTAYREAGQAVFVTVHHPDLEGGGVTVYHGNSETALANARLLGYYPNSLLVFDTPPDPAGQPSPPGGMPATKVVKRMDFESHDRIEF